MHLGEDTLPNALPWTQIPSVLYSPYTDMSTVIPALQQRSSVRREGDERFQAYMQLLARVEELNEQDTLPLNYAKRKAKARSERELTRIQNDLLDQEEASDDEAEPDPTPSEDDATALAADNAADDEADDTEEDKSPDLVLREGLSILADLVELSPATENAETRAITASDVHTILRGMQE